MSITTGVRLLCGPLHRRAWQEVAFQAAGLVPAVCFPLAPWLRPALTAAQASRFAALLGRDVPTASDAPEARGLRQFASPPMRRQLAYHVLAAPLIGLAALCVLIGWAAGLLLLSVPLWSWAAPPGSAVGAGRGVLATQWAVLLGLGVLWVASGLGALLAAADAEAADRLLGPDRMAELTRRVETLAESRADVVDAADAERRRIERDLHDGAQQRLVALSMNLGLAQRTARGLPAEQRAEAAMAAMAEAHQEAQAAIAELRDLVRGLHPAVLDDRGLDAALSGIAARAPLPVRLTVELPQRPAPTVEAVAYFVVSEALTNVAKHAHAAHADVLVRRLPPQGAAQQGPGRQASAAGGDADRLLITVTDDGVGGADAAHGTGLAGLRRRVASVDGEMTLTSPAGGPTVLRVELPCVL